MARRNSTLQAVPGLLGKLPCFELCEDSGKYKARRKLTPEQIIRAAKVALTHRFTRGTVLTSQGAATDYLAVHYRDKPAEVFT